ncbi:extracellular solute-binding protein [Paenibacillus donghaensis]|uniref:ABC transporter substrate-binding protein n=1 Tax=Paenibacillus donghaensis TaxID=414771 RepID=A0A2Z2KIQ8_9BACL|nr:extracellular solute-binding protein [Paenibacillus donghaensis]ASA20772.1 hypothetical protein B9T62_08230 [Paenibacillus donghaensis]
MKRKLMLMAAGVFLIALLTGCAGSGTHAAKEKEVIHLWHPLTGGDGDYFNEIVDRFNAVSQDYRVKVSVFKWDDYNAKLSNGIASDAGPELAVARNSFYSFLRAKDLTLDLTDAAHTAGIPWQDYNPLALSLVKEDERYYGSPIDTHPVVMFYNKDLLDRAGVLDPAGQPVFERSEAGFLEFLDKIAAVQPKGQYPLALPTYSKSAEHWYLWNTWYAQNGGTGLLNADFSAADINRKAFYTSAGMESKLFNHPYILPDDTDFTQTFVSGRAAIIITGVWATSKFMDQVPSLGAAAIPNLWNDQELYYGGSHVLIVPSNVMETSKQTGAAQFIKFFNENGLEWAKAGHVPVDTKIWTSKAYLDMPFRDLYTRLAGQLQYVEPQKDIFGIYENLLSPLMESVWRGKYTPQQGYEELTADLNFQLSY